MAKLTKDAQGRITETTTLKDGSILKRVFIKEAFEFNPAEFENTLNGNKISMAEYLDILKNEEANQ